MNQQMRLRKKWSRPKVHVFRTNLTNLILLDSILRNWEVILTIKDLKLSRKVSSKGRIKNWGNNRNSNFSRPVNPSLNRNNNHSSINPNRKLNLISHKSNLNSDILQNRKSNLSPSIILNHNLNLFLFLQFHLKKCWMKEKRNCLRWKSTTMESLSK